MTTTTYRRTSWVALLPRPEVATETGSLASVERDRIIRELLRNEPDIFVTGMFAGMDMSKYHWKDFYTPTEVEIIVQCMGYTRFDYFLQFMLIMYPEKKETKVQHHAIRLWDQIMNIRGE